MLSQQMLTVIDTDMTDRQKEQSQSVDHQSAVKLNIILGVVFEQNIKCYASRLF